MENSNAREIALDIITGQTSRLNEEIIVRLPKFSMNDKITGVRNKINNFSPLDNNDIPKFFKKSF